ncbi:40S ribosomal protein S3-3 [Orobanche gracilis]
MATQMSKRRKFVADGVFFAELNELLTRELAEDGYSGVEVRVTPVRAEIIIRATRTQNVLDAITVEECENSPRLFKRGSSFQKTVPSFMLKELATGAYVQLLRLSPCVISFLEGFPSGACYGVLRFVMENGAKGCEVIVSGKLRAQRAKSMKFNDGYMISAGHPVKD